MLDVVTHNMLCQAKHDLYQFKVLCIYMWFIAWMQLHSSTDHNCCTCTISVRTEPVNIKLILQCNISEMPWTFHKPNRNLYGGFNTRRYKLVYSFFLIKPYNWTLSLACEVPWPWGGRKCNDRHQSNINIILLYTNVWLPLLSTFAGIYCKSADT